METLKLFLRKNCFRLFKIIENFFSFHERSNFISHFLHFGSVLLMDIILDTNIFRTDFMLKSSTFKTFIDYLRKTRSTLIIPQIVMEELMILYDREIYKRKKELDQALNSYNKISINAFYFLSEDETSSLILYSSYKKYFFKQFEYTYIDEVEYKDAYFKEVINRAIKRIKPCSSKGEEFRDSILWLTILDCIKSNRYDDCVFISNNVNDFADDSGKCLHASLLKELKEKCIKLDFFSSLQDFNKTWAVKIDFITSDWLTKNIDWVRLNREACKEGNIHCSYFFELFDRRSKMKGCLEYYEIVNTYLDEQISDFCVYEISENNYSVEIHLSGIIETNFIVNVDKSGYDLKTEPLVTEFGTQTNITIINGVVCSYTDEYAEEESSLNYS